MATLNDHISGRSRRDVRTIQYSLARLKDHFGTSINNGCRAGNTVAQGTSGPREASQALVLTDIQVCGNRRWCCREGRRRRMNTLLSLADNSRPAFSSRTRPMHSPENTYPQCEKIWIVPFTMNRHSYVQVRQLLSKCNGGWQAHKSRTMGYCRTGRLRPSPPAILPPD